MQVQRQFIQIVDGGASIINHIPPFSGDEITHFWHDPILGLGNLC